MDLERWDPWSEMDRLHAETDRLLGVFLDKLHKALPGELIGFVPAMDIVESASDYHVYVSVPGILEEDIDLTVEHGCLIVRGERDRPYDPERGRALHSEWKYGFFERRLDLPIDVDDKRIVATCESGMLTIRLPKRDV